MGAAILSLLAIAAIPAMTRMATVSEGSLETYQATEIARSIMEEYAVLGAAMSKSGEFGDWQWTITEMPDDERNGAENLKSMEFLDVNVDVSRDGGGTTSLERLFLRETR